MEYKPKNTSQSESNEESFTSSIQHKISLDPFLSKTGKLQKDHHLPPLEMVLGHTAKWNNMSSKSEDYLPGNDRTSAFLSSFPQWPTAETSFWANVVKKEGLPSSTYPHRRDKASPWVWCHWKYLIVEGPIALTLTSKRLVPYQEKHAKKNSSYSPLALNS